MILQERLDAQKDKSFVMLTVGDGKLVVNRWSGDALLSEIRRRVKEKGGGFDPEVIWQVVCESLPGTVYSYAVRFNFAVVGGK